MKRILTIILFAAAVTACSYDDSNLLDRIDGLESRVEQLEKAAASANADIVTLQGLISAVQNNVTITSVADNGNGGYTITFSDGQTFTITSGRDGTDGVNGTNAPVISIKKDSDDIYYWTVDGEWLLVDGDKVKAVGTDGQNGQDGQDAVVPQIRINAETGNWEISTDKGINWASVGPATAEGSGDYLFRDITVGEDSVTITLSDGAVIEIPRTTDMGFVVNEGSTMKVKYGTTAGFDVAAIGIADHTVVSMPRGWDAYYEAETAKLNVTAPEENKSYAEYEGEIVMLLIGRTGTSMLAKMAVEAWDATYTITFEGEYWEPFVAVNYNGATYTNAVHGNYTYPLWVDATTQLTTDYPTRFNNDTDNSIGFDYPWILSSYNSNDINGDPGKGWYLTDLYAYNPINKDSTAGGGYNSSDNFLVSFGYYEPDGPFSFGDFRPVLTFADKKARTIKSLYVNSTNYFLSVVAYGNGLSPALAPGEDVILYATGYDADGNEIKTITMVYADYEHVTNEWTEWDLSELGPVVSLKLNQLGGTDNGYGYSLPAYYAIDDITIELD